MYGGSSSGGDNRISIDSSELCTVPAVVATAQSLHSPSNIWKKVICIINIKIYYSFRSINPLLFYTMLNTDPVWLPAGEASFSLLLINSMLYTSLAACWFASFSLLLINSMWYTLWRSQLLFVSYKLIILIKDYNHISIDRSMYSGTGGSSSSGGDNRISIDSSELCTVPAVVATAQSDCIQLPTFGKR